MILNLFITDSAVRVAQHGKRRGLLTGAPILDFTPIEAGCDRLLRVGGGLAGILPGAVVEVLKA
jgi:hypothetical protein